MSVPDRPGVRKAREPQVLQEWRPSLVRSSDPLAQRLLAAADVMSEGAAREEAGRSVYYGSTSILLPLRSRGGPIPDERIDDALRWSRSDPHLRLRVLRLAHREAAQRANGALARLQSEMVFSKVQCGLCIDVEVEAALASERQRRPA